MLNVASTESPKARFWDIGCGETVPLQTYTLPVPRSWELSGGVGRGSPCHGLGNLE